MNIKEIYMKYKDILMYILFGASTTAINVIIYWILAHPFNLDIMISTFMAWATAVLFAYVTNRKWVFHSEASTSVEIAKEVSSFYACRIVTGMIDWLCMFIAVDTLHFNDILVKIFANVLVVILNYIASKLIIFKQNKGNK